MKKLQIYHLLEKGSHGSKYNLVVDYSIMTLIILNVIAMIFETVSEIELQYHDFFNAFEAFSIVIFSLEYVLRLYISDLSHPASTKWKSAALFIFSIYGLIDLVAILPFYLPLLFPIDLRFLRILRLLRFFRIFKINRYNNSLHIIGQVIKEKKPELAITGFLSILIIIVASFLMYFLEGKVQPEKFPNVIASFWWAITTLTTLGYGDVVPITAWGKVVSGLIAVLGIGIIALPTGIISAGFINFRSSNNKDYENETCPHCGKKIH